VPEGGKANARRVASAHNRLPGRGIRITLLAVLFECREVSAPDGICQEGMAMSLKVLRIVVSRDQNILGTYYVGVPDMLRRIGLPRGSTSMGAGTKEAPIAGMRTVPDWGTAIDSLRGIPEQWIRLGAVYVKKAAGKTAEDGTSTGSYYMNAEGIVTKGVTDRGGPSCNELGGLLKGLTLSDAEIAAGVRKVLSRESGADTGETSKILACLTAAMFLAEPRRNARAFAINLMLLDFVEGGVTYGASNRDFSWQTILWRTAFGRDAQAPTKTYRFEEGNQQLEPHQRGGKLPMSNTDASEQSRATIPPHPVDGASILMPNSEMDKEGSIVVRWLQHVLNRNKAAGQVAGVLPPNATPVQIVKGPPMLATQYSYTGLKAAPDGNIPYLKLDVAPKPGSAEYFIVASIRNALDYRCKNLSLPAMR